jgi:membrane peptidoglycan carboxypeptidase
MTNLARRLGITTFDDPDRLGLAVTLGGGEVRLLELATAYAVLANGGSAIQPLAIQRVEDAEGNVLLTSGTATGERILDERVAYLLSDILSDDVARTPSFGVDSILKLTRPAAVKTGTTTDFRDNWTVGYTAAGPADSGPGSSRGLVVGVWTGNADNEPMRDVSGIDGAAPIWHDFMEAALKGQPSSEFLRPEGLVEVEVCALSGLLPERDCPHRVTELFIEGTEPTEHCTMHQRMAIDRTTGQRATADTPADRIVERVYTILPPEAQEWARQQGIPQPPPVLDPGWRASEPGSQVAKLDPANPSPLSQSEEGLVMSSPDPGAVFRLDPTLSREAQRIEVAARPGAAVSLVEVTLLVDGLPLARFGMPPYAALWQLKPGLHVFSAEGESGSGEGVTSNEVWIEVHE